MGSGGGEGWGWRHTEGIDYLLLCLVLWNKMTDSENESTCTLNTHETKAIWINVKQNKLKK